MRSAAPIRLGSALNPIDASAQNVLERSCGWKRAAIWLTFLLMACTSGRYMLPMVAIAHSVSDTSRAPNCFACGTAR
eukprot:CAMPEP_0202847930 /NCGR_PEP_ID=MMETSP1389-20130828/76681_1 /ASSEMBLY_ACC=CAM_ASM_000865 /TAXON_ID=302021 /ORGANISM="Rhodomonas sp., Strain CCMP768" /LENGTH=76 /DNA_ID=CAMNT_0049525711 /DNA_START=29 /DNA_END=255 /DNA_ORIENTATION=+